MEVDSYFTYYENLEIREIMLRDRPRQEAYKRVIMSNRHLFNDKIVMDVGAGTGILSAFCAKAGAKLVYAIEASRVAEIVLKVMEDNKLTAVIQCKVEDFNLPSNNGKVDIIVSEWMGFYLLPEGMLNSVLFARDKFLKANGLMFPNECTMFVALCSVPSRFDDWKNVDNIFLTEFSSKLRAQKFTKPEIMQISDKDLLHHGVAMHWMNLLDVEVQDLNEIIFQELLVAEKTGKHQGFCIWFQCRFPSDNYEGAAVLTTAPNAPLTHWKQCLVVLPESACEEIEEFAPISFKITLRRRLELFVILYNIFATYFNIVINLVNSCDIDSLPDLCLKFGIATSYLSVTYHFKIFEFLSRL